MKSGIYTIKVTARFENPKNYGMCTMLLENGQKIFYI